MLRRSRIDAPGALHRVAEVLGINRAEVLSSDRQYHRVKARSLVCFWASRELGMSGVKRLQRKIS